MTPLQTCSPRARIWACMANAPSSPRAPVSSNAARYPQPNGGPYAAAKAALNAYSKSLALACGPHGVRVTAVMPGVIETDAVEAALRQAAQRTGRDLDTVRKEFHQRLAAPLGRPGQPEEAAELI